MPSTSPASVRSCLPAFLPGPRRKQHLLIPIAYHRDDGRTVGIDPVVLRAITIAWNDIRIPIGPRHGHRDEKPSPRLTNGLGFGTGCRQAAQHQARSKSERDGHCPHVLASLQTQTNEHLLMMVPGAAMLQPARQSHGIVLPGREPGDAERAHHHGERDDAGLQLSADDQKLRSRHRAAAPGTA